MIKSAEDKVFDMNKLSVREREREKSVIFIIKFVWGSPVFPSFSDPNWDHGQNDSG